MVENPYPFFKPNTIELTEGERKLLELPWNAYLYVTMGKTIQRTTDKGIAEELRKNNLSRLQQLTPGEHDALMDYVSWQTQRMVIKNADRSI